MGSNSSFSARKTALAMAWQRIAGISVVLFVCSAIWSITCYWFITDWQLPHVWPLCAILLLAGLTALYFYPEGLLSFMMSVQKLLHARQYGYQ